MQFRCVTDPRSRLRLQGGFLESLASWPELPHLVRKVQHPERGIGIPVRVDTNVDLSTSVAWLASESSPAPPTKTSHDQRAPDSPLGFLDFVPSAQREPAPSCSPKALRFIS